MLLDNKYNVNCDIRDCSNKAEYLFVTKGRLGRFFICSHCLAELTSQFRQRTTPKSPKNVIKKALDKDTITEV